MLWELPVVTENSPACEIVPFLLFLLALDSAPIAGIVGSQAGTEVPAFLCVFLDCSADSYSSPPFVG